LTECEMVDDCADDREGRRKRWRRERKEVNRPGPGASKRGRSSEDLAGRECGSRETGTALGKVYLKESIAQWT
jgi:hypothetical protein